MWLFCISSIGVYNIFRWNPHVFRALSPYYMFQFLRKTERGGWMSLGGILLCMTGEVIVHFDSNAITSKLFGCFPNTYPHISRFGSHVCWSWTLFTIVNQGRSVNYTINRLYLGFFTKLTWKELLFKQLESLHYYWCRTLYCSIKPFFHPNLIISRHSFQILLVVLSCRPPFIRNFRLK